MRIAISTAVAFLCLSFAQLGQAQDTTILPTDDPSFISLNSETSNNTSACYAAGNPSGCTGTPLPLPTSTANANAGAETTTVDALPEHISTISVHRLMYKGWNGKLLCEYQPWFCNASNPCNSHISIGYNETDPTVNAITVKSQNTNMISRGCNINFVDFYGNANTDTTFKLNRQGADAVYKDLANRTNFPLKLGILEDVNAFKTACSAAGLSEQQTIACIETALKADMNYIYQTYIFNTPGVYWSDQSTNVVGFFGSCATFPALETGTPPSCSADWDTIWTDVQNYVTNSGYNMKFIFQFGVFGFPTISAGEFAWPQLDDNPQCEAEKNCFTANTGSQLFWCGIFFTTCTGSSSNYLDQFYLQGSQDITPGHLTIGALYKGFDDSNANWGVDRVMAEQCGQVFVATANEVVAGGYWGNGTNSTHQIPYMQIATWNDYEEGTEVESGIDNCYTAVNLTSPTSTSKITWTLTSSDSTYANATKTVHHYALWTAPSGGSTLTLKKQFQVPVNFLLSSLGLAAGTYDVWVEMVGQPSMQNEMSNKVSYTQN